MSPEVVAANSNAAPSTPLGPQPDTPASSVLAQVRARAAAQRATRTKDVPVGGAFGDRLVVRYGFLPAEHLDRYAELAAGPRGLEATDLIIDMMVSACREVLWIEAGAETDLGVKLDASLWRLLDWPLPEGIDDPGDLLPREVVMALFGGNPVALVTHGEQLINWMQDPGGGDVVGEASRASS